jgi:DNA polymerase III epsilon subunit-like protein
MTKLIFFDTETTGLPSNDRIPALNHKANWPDIVSICWMVFENHTFLKKEEYIIRPEQFTIPPESTKIHGITQRMAEQEGTPLGVVLAKFAEDIKGANVLCAHNLHFDKNVFFHAYKWRLNRDPLRIWPSSSEFCTMKESQDELKLPTKYPTATELYKRPKLSELYYAQFGVPMENAHTAAGDVEALQRIFFARWEYA